jgi:hypothetical protein
MTSKEQLRGINHKAALLSEEARGMAVLFEKFANAVDPDNDNIDLTGREMADVLYFVKSTARRFESEFSTISHEADSAAINTVSGS